MSLPPLSHTAAELKQTQEAYRAQIAKFGLTDEQVQKYIRASQAFTKISQGSPTLKELRIAKEVAHNKHTVTFRNDGRFTIHIKRKMEDGTGLLGKGSYKKVYLSLECDGKMLTPKADVTIFGRIHDVVRENEIATVLQNSGAKHTMEPGTDVMNYRSKSAKHPEAERMFMSMPLYNFSMDSTAPETQSCQSKLEMSYGAAFGLYEMHREGIVHRDLKLDNVLVKVEEREGKQHLTAKVSDFGFAVYERDLDPGQLPSGNRIAQPPEVHFPAPGKSAVLNQTSKADVWALGIMLHQLFFTEHHDHYPMFAYDLIQGKPIDQNTIDQYFDRLPILTMFHKFDNDAGKLMAVMGIIKDCLKYDPEERITAEEAAIRFESLL